MGTFQSGNQPSGGPAGTLAYLLLLLATTAAAYWGTAEFFHEGWFAPYGKYLIFYLLPMLLLMALTLFSLSFPRLGGIVIVLLGIGFTLWRYSRLKALHLPVAPSLWIMGFVLSLPGLLLWWKDLRQRKEGATRAGNASGRRWKARLVLILPLLVMIGVGIPLLIRNLQRVPLEHFGEVTVEGNGITLTFAPAGLGWLYSNRHPIEFRGKAYSGLSWNEIALFGKPPIGFEGKRYGSDYNGTPASIYYATREDFDRYNMFRYIDSSGTVLTDSLHDYWRLPTAEEYERCLTYRGKNAGGEIDSASGKVRYRHTPDKEGPLWAPQMEVIYYWTASCADEQHAYDISYSGRVRPVLKTSKQDYRGFRAVRVKPQQNP